MRFIRALLTLLHIFLGLILLVLTGCFWNPHTQLVKRTKRWWLTQIVSLLGISIELIGERPQPQPGRALVYVSNHVSWVDIPVIGSQVNLCFLSKAEVKDWPLIGYLAKSVGTLFIKRGSGDAMRVVKQIAEYVRSGYSVLFFPEATTTNGANIKKFHSKLFRISEYTEVDYCPVVISYKVPGHPDNPVAFIDDDEFNEHIWNLFGLKGVTVKVRFLPVRQINPKNLETEVTRMQSEMTQQLHELQPHITAAVESDTSQPAATQEPDRSHSETLSI